MATRTRHNALQSYRYRARRIGFIALACVCAVLGIFLLAFNFGFNSRTQQVAVQYVNASQPVADVLLVMSYDESEANTPLARNGVLDVMNRSSVNVDVVYMDAYNAPLGSDAYNAWVSQLGQKVAQHGRYAAVICADDEALYFIENYHDSMFPSTPVVFFGINDFNHARYAMSSGYMTGMVEQSYVGSMMQATQRLMPDATSFTVIIDETPAGVGNRAQFDTAIKSFEDMAVSYVNASHLTREELAASVAGAGSDTIVFLLDANTDRYGNVYTLDNTVAYITGACSYPVFRATIGGVGAGVAGSAFLDPESDGQRAAQLAIRVLNGTKPAEIELVKDGTLGYVFDQQVLNAHGLSTSDLPAGSSVVNRNYLSFDTFRLIALPVALFVLAAVFFVSSLRLGRAATTRIARPVPTPVPAPAPQKAELEQGVYRDDLTGHQNMQWLAEFSRSSQADDIRALVEVEIVAYDDIVAAFGREVGEGVLRTVTERMEGLEKAFLVRSADAQFFLGFETEISHGCQQIDFLEYLLRQPVILGDETVEIDTRMAVTNRQQGMSIDDMIAGADYAIRQAREFGGGHSVVFYDSNMRHAMEDTREITALLRRAVDNEDFVIYYQPQIDLRVNDVAGYEALVRLKNDEYPPSQFIPVAEMNGLIVDIDRIVAKRSIEQLAKWKKRNKRLRPISINFSTAHLMRDDDFVAFLLEELAANDIPADYVKLEITEGFFSANSEKVETVLRRLIDGGVTIALDKFGAGYTSFSDVMSVPAALVKIDKAFVDTFLVDGNDDNFENLVRLAHGLGKKVVVVGIEKKWQIEICRELDCDIVQGYYFSKPLSPENAVQYRPSASA
ncbi:MAG: EAL domain-containing protein [Coriobacteriales bacterium]